MTNTEGTIICRNDPESDHRHSTVDEVWQCWLRGEEARAEIAAENAWLVAAEAGTPETWADEDRDRLIALYGYGPPSF